MENKMIGFLGAEKYDILLYLSRILYRLNKKVLLVDYAENRALTYCVPVPRVITIQKECIHYQGIDFLVEPAYTELMEVKNQYDIILVDFGFQVYSKLLSECGQIYLCMDQQLHNMMQLRPIQQMEELTSRCYLLFRQIYDCKIGSNYLLEELGLPLKERQVFAYYQDSMDMKYCIDSQYNHTFQFAHISRGLKSCLLFILRNVLPSLTEQQRKSAYRVAKAASAAGKG